MNVMLPLAAALSVSLGAMAQQAMGSPHRLMSQSTSNRFVQMQERAKARSVEIHNAWLASGHPDLPPLQPPTIIGGKILTPSLDVAKQPAAPKVNFRFKTGNAGIREIRLYLQPASGSDQELYMAHYVTNHSLPVTQGEWAIQEVGDSYGDGAFNPYSDHGKWLFYYAYIYDQAGAYTYYDQAALATAFGCPGATGCISLTVANAGKPDNNAPLITGGKLLTPKVALDAAQPDFVARLVVSDDISGVASTFINVCPPSGSTGYCVSYSNYPPAPFRKGSNLNYDWLCYSTNNDCSKTARGTWTIHYMGACDVASNCLYDYDTNDIMHAFGTTTFVVKPHA